MKKLVLWMLVLMVCSCTNKQGAKNTSAFQEFFNINLEEILGNKEQVNLSQLASNVEYIKLETNDNCMIGPTVDYFFMDSLIFVKNRDHILKFSRDGKFLKRIGNPGRGPGEIDLTRVVSILPEKRLIIVQLNRKRELLYFNFDGELVKTVGFNAPFYHIKVLNDERYLINNFVFVGNEPYTFILANEKWDTLSFIENFIKWIHNSSTWIGISYPDFKPDYLANGQLHLKSLYNDTVYILESDKIKPSYFLNLGKYKLPEELIPERLGFEQIQKFREHSNEYLFGIVLEAGNKVFLKARSYKGSINKYVLFSKIQHKGVLLINNYGDSKGFVNDWDGGIDFWPVGTINYNQIYMPVNILDFQKALKENKTRKISARYPEKQKQLTDMVSDLDVTANPILMVITLKNDK
jgi:hypothetical protein